MAQQLQNYNKLRVVRPVPRKPRRRNPFAKITSIMMMLAIGVFVLPLSFRQVMMSIPHGSLYPTVKVDYQTLRFPTSDYLSNHLAFGTRLLRSADKNPQMTPLRQTNRLTGLEKELSGLMHQYPAVHPAVYVLDFDNGNYVDINGSELFAAASIIKLPVLIHMFNAIEDGQFSLTDTMTLDEPYKAIGSGSLQYKPGGTKYTIDELARLMVTESDNSSTNMLVAKLGSMNDVNNGIWRWGLKNTSMQSWLPDLDGTNKTTARDIATVLYNVDNPKFLTMSSRERIFDYMGNVANNRLIAAGLGTGADFLHKTGDIGSMLGDAGIVFTPTGKKYIVVILANRPHNSVQGKEFIVKASEMIYNNMTR